MSTLGSHPTGGCHVARRDTGLKACSVSMHMHMLVLSDSDSIAVNLQLNINPWTHLTPSIAWKNMNAFKGMLSKAHILHQRASDKRGISDGPDRDGLVIWYYKTGRLGSLLTCVVQRPLPAKTQTQERERAQSKAHSVAERG
ncbi:hypothetical protein VNO77_28645 [Canavalia gladiata]|uniref:Uncharacterized protein n=1 Tax=Canavalia gladiata TaxID=3824 RepID=A0AAN9QBA9_CANGL